MSFVDKNTERDQASVTYGGKKISTYGKLVIMEVIAYYVENVAVANQYESKLKAAVESMYKHQDTDIDGAWDDFLKALEVESANGALMLAYTCYNPDRNDLLYRTIYAYGKIKKLESQTSWFDNFRLNGLANGMNHIVWMDTGADKLYAINVKPAPINMSNTLMNSDRVLKHLVGELRRFIIENNLYQTNAPYKIVKPKANMTMSAQEVCDKCYEHYPFYYGGAHGCDFYELAQLSINLDECNAFLQRYPSAIIGFILNTASYTSKSGGQHWVSFLMKKDNYYYINSTGQTIQESLTTGPDFERRLQGMGYGGQWNDKRLQEDNYSCGMFAFISMYLMLSYNCDLYRTVNSIGVDGTHLVKDFKVNIRSFTKVLASPDSTEKIDVNSGAVTGDETTNDKK